MRQGKLCATKAQLSELVQLALDGEVVWIARGLLALAGGDPCSWIR